MGLFYCLLLLLFSFMLSLPVPGYFQLSADTVSEKSFVEIIETQDVVFLQR